MCNIRRKEHSICQASDVVEASVHQVVPVYDSSRASLRQFIYTIDVNYDSLSVYKIA
jgi:hypothetical protein